MITEKTWIKIAAVFVMWPLILMDWWLFRTNALGLGILLLAIIVSLFRFIRNKHESIGDNKNV